MDGDEEVEQSASRIVASVFGADPDFGTGRPARPPRLLSDELAAEIARQAREIGLR